MGDPGYEAGARTAQFLGAKVHRVPLRKDYTHDVQAMVKAAPDAGLFYICNPNNPTGTVTPREDIEWLLNNKPEGSILLLDEAYIHFSDAQMGSDLLAKEKDLIILRTFSKAYGMAGIRAGMAMGRPDLLEKLRPFGTGFMPITALAAATASLKVKTLVAERKKINATVRGDVFNWLEQKKFSYVPSVSNKFMLETNKPGMETVEAMRKQNVYIGRVWPAMPTHVRVSIGTQDEMNKFKAALLKVMA
jgi:histidinol-phosphate/aromatic aminotransferase/cobyric acid decarboxylase-like protein